MPISRVRSLAETSMMFITPMPPTRRPIEEMTIMTRYAAPVIWLMRGRGLALYTLTFFGFAPFGNLAIGTLSQQWGISVTLLLSAALSLALAAPVIILVPRVRKMR